MIHLHGNRLGIGMFVIGGLIAGLGAFVFKLPDPMAMIIVGASLVVLDVIARRVLYRVDPSWVREDRGGSLFRVPIWLFGLLVIAANVLSGLARAPSVS